MKIDEKHNEGPLDWYGGPVPTCECGSDRLPTGYGKRDRRDGSYEIYICPDCLCERVE